MSEEDKQTRWLSIFLTGFDVNSRGSSVLLNLFEVNTLISLYLSVHDAKTELWPNFLRIVKLLRKLGIYNQYGAQTIVTGDNFILHDIEDPHFEQEVTINDEVNTRSPEFDALLIEASLSRIKYKERLSAIRLLASRQKIFKDLAIPFFDVFEKIALNEKSSLSVKHQAFLSIEEILLNTREEDKKYFFDKLMPYLFDGAKSDMIFTWNMPRFIKNFYRDNEIPNENLTRISQFCIENKRRLWGEGKRYIHDILYSDKNIENIAYMLHHNYEESQF